MNIPFNEEKLNEKMEELFNSAMESYEEEHNTEEAYIELLDEISGEIQIGSLTYSAGNTLKQIDETAFRCGMSEESDRYYEQFKEENNLEDFRDSALESLDMEEEN